MIVRLNFLLLSNLFIQIQNAFWGTSPPDPPLVTGRRPQAPRVSVYK